MQPIKFIPLLKQTIWGGEKISALKHRHMTINNIGESWEISGVKNDETIADNEPYQGKTVKLEGNFSVYHDEEGGRDIFAAIVPDATACCQQGIEFVLGDDYKYPDDYPEEGTSITIKGTFNNSYVECYPIYLVSTYLNSELGALLL